MQAGRQTDRQTGTQTGRQADRQTDKQTDTKTGRQTDRQTDRKTDRLENKQKYLSPVVLISVERAAALMDPRSKSALVMYEARVGSSIRVGAASAMPVKRLHIG